METRSQVEPGMAVIEKVRTDKPDASLKIVASLLPKDINLNVRPLDELSDDQLLARLAQLTETRRLIAIRPSRKPPGIKAPRWPPTPLRAMGRTPPAMKAREYQRLDRNPDHAEQDCRRK
jgi:hypothetical protein